jgi:hypothetical protein
MKGLIGLVLFLWRFTKSDFIVHPSYFILFSWLLYIHAYLLCAYGA